MRKYVVGYLPEWRYEAYKNTRLENLTHMNIAFINPDGQGKMSSAVPDREMKNIVAAAHEKGVKVMASLGGFGGCDGYAPLISDRGRMSAFNKNIMDFCGKFAFDGIDLDMELWQGHGLWKYYPEWVSSLRELCGGEGYILSTASAQWLTPRVSAEVFGMFDFVNVMAYDNESGPVSHSDVNFARETLDFFGKGFNIPRERLILGVPFYGRGTGGHSPYDKCTPFSELLRLDSENYSRDTYNGIAYNGAGTVAEKTRIAREYGGVMIWEISQDAPPPYSLLDVINENLGGKQAC